MNAIFLVIILFWIGFVTFSNYKNQKKQSQKLFLVLLFLMHFFCAGYAYYYTIKMPFNDASSFYENAKIASSWFSVFSLGSWFMTFLIYPLVKIGVSLFTLFLLSSALSYQGFLIYYKRMATVSSYSFEFLEINFFQWLLLLPGMHFWSGFLGKDAVVFLFFAVILPPKDKTFALDVKNIIVLFFLGLLRPHLFFVVVFVLFFIFLLNKSLSKNKKIIITVFLGVLLLTSLPILKIFLRLKRFSYDAILEQFAVLNQFAQSSASASGINFVDSNYVERIWLLLFRPLFFDAKTGEQLLVSIENGIILSFFIFSLLYIFKRRDVLKMTKDVKFAFFVGNAVMLLIAVYIYNMGLATRMRLMFWPYLFYSFHQIISSSSQSRVKY